MPASRMDGPRTRIRKVDCGCLMSTSFRSIRLTAWSSAGDGKPAWTDWGRATMGRRAPLTAGAGSSVMSAHSLSLYMHTV